MRKARLHRGPGHPHPVVKSYRIIPSNGEEWEPGSGTGFFIAVTSDRGEEGLLINDITTTEKAAHAVGFASIGKPVEMWD